MTKKNETKQDGLTPAQIVAELDRFIIGQNAAKKAVAIALRNRYRRQQVPSPLRDDIMPKNILSIGPTGVGKTEIARRLAKLAQAPFVKVEATKFTEVGYVGRDVDSIIRDLVEVAVKMTRQRMRREILDKAKNKAKEKVLKILVGENASEETRKKFLQMLDKGQLNDKEIEIEISDNSPSPFSSTFDIPGAQIGMINLGEIINKTVGGTNEKTKKIKLNVSDALRNLAEEESNKLLDEDRITKLAVEITESEGIVFIDEIDKICNQNSFRNGDVSTEGVQRDLLPLIEGTIVNSKYGPVKTDHILFIASGAFHTCKPSDLLPELQGRFPIRVQLNALTEEDLARILQEPESSLIKQYIALIEVENVKLDFTEDGIKEIAKLAYKVNSEVENIGARRLYTLLEKILEDANFKFANLKKRVELTIDKQYVNDHIGDLISSKNDLSKFIL